MVVDSEATRDPILFPAIHCVGVVSCLVLSCRTIPFALTVGLALEYGVEHLDSVTSVYPDTAHGRAVDENRECDGRGVSTVGNGDGERERER